MLLLGCNRQWRKEEKVDDILSEANGDFDIIKKYYPHFYFKQAKNGECGGTNGGNAHVCCVPAVCFLARRGKMVWMCPGFCLLCGLGGVIWCRVLLSDIGQVSHSSVTTRRYSTGHDS